MSLRASSLPSHFFHWKIEFLLLWLVRHFNILFSKTWKNILFAVIHLSIFPRTSPGPVYHTNLGRSPTFFFKTDWNHLQAKIERFSLPKTPPYFLALISRWCWNPYLIGVWSCIVFMVLKFLGIISIQNQKHLVNPDFSSLKYRKINLLDN